MNQARRKPLTNWNADHIDFLGHDLESIGRKLQEFDDGFMGRRIVRARELGAEVCRIASEVLALAQDVEAKARKEDGS